MEPPSKKNPTDFSLCLKCQKKSGTLSTPSPGSFKTFIDSVTERSSYGNMECLAISRRIHGLTPAILQERGAKWHTDCYKAVINKTTKGREKNSFRLAVKLDSSPVVNRKPGRPAVTPGYNCLKENPLVHSPSSSCTKTYTRSAAPKYERTKCIFCQGDQFVIRTYGSTTKRKELEKTHECRSVNIGQSLKEIIEKSGRADWQVRLADVIVDGDFLSRDVCYHNSCKLKYWGQYVKNSEPEVSEEDEPTTPMITAQIEFLYEVKETLDEGVHLSMNEVENMFREKTKSLNNVKNKSRNQIKQLILENIDDCTMVPRQGQKTEVFQSKGALRKAVDSASENNNKTKEMTTLFEATKILRKRVIEKKGNKYEFDGSMNGSERKGVPEELPIFSRWLLHGTKTPDARCADTLDRSCNFLSQYIVQETKTTRQMTFKHVSESELSPFYHTRESPFALGLGLHIYHNYRSKKVLDLLSSCGISVNYARVKELVNQIAAQVHGKIRNQGVYVPPGLQKGQIIRASCDNIDKKVDTPDGKKSFHGLASAIYQRKGDGDEIVDPLVFHKGSKLEKLSNIPSTVIQLIPCKITGSPKPRGSPQYAGYFRGRHRHEFEASEMTDVIWLLVRSLYRGSHNALTTPDDPSVPAAQPQLLELATEKLDPQNEQAAIEPNEHDEFMAHSADDIALQQSQSMELPEGNVDDSVQNEIDLHQDQEAHKVATHNQGTEDTISSPSVQESKEQSVPLWAAYNSIIKSQTENHHTDKASSMPIINSPAQDWSSLITCLDQLLKVSHIVSGPGKKVNVTLDMDLYKRVFKLEHLDDQFKDKFIFHPGAFHVVVCTLRCLVKLIEGSGLDAAWVEADLYGSVTVSQIINGNHYSRGLDAHLITLQTLHDLWLEAFLDSHPLVQETLQSKARQLTEAIESQDANDIRTAHFEFCAAVESMNIMVQMKAFDTANDDYPIFKWTRMYMQQVGLLTMLQFQRATRQGDWLLYLSSLEQLSVLFFAFNRLDYAQHIPEYVARMYQMQTDDPQMWIEMLQGGFTIKTNEVPFTSIGIDHAQEWLNKGIKGIGGISGITTSPDTLLKFCLSAPELARLALETEQMLGISKSKSGNHHMQSKSKAIRQEKAIAKLKNVLEPCKIFHKSTGTPDDNPDDNKGKLFNLMSKEIVTDEVCNGILATMDKGEEALNKFIQDRIVGETNLWAKMTKVKVLTWNSMAKSFTVKQGCNVKTLKATASLFARLLVVARSERDDIDLEEVIGMYEFAMTNKMLLKNDGSLLPTTGKSRTIHLLEELVNKSKEDGKEPSVDNQPDPDKTKGIGLVIDGMAVVQEEMAVKDFNTCEDLARAFVDKINTKGQGYYQVRVIFDNYTIKKSFKDATRKRRSGKSVNTKGYLVEDRTPIRDKKSFLSSKETKASLTLYLASKVIAHCSVPVVAVTHASVSCTPSTIYPSTGVSSQEEADTLMILHGKEMSESGMTIHIYSQDTDVLLLAIRRVPVLGPKTALIMGTGGNRRLVMLKPIYDVLGPEKAAALVNWHVLTGCDTTGRIFGKSKDTCFTAFLESQPNVIDSLAKLGEGDEPDAGVLQGCEEFLCSLFCSKTERVHHTSAAKLRWHHFKKLGHDQGVEKLPPTSGAWEEAIRRAHLQCSIYHQDLVLHPSVPDPLNLGWKLEGNNFLVPLLSKIPPAPSSVIELVSCRCGKSNPQSTDKCSRRCTCKSKGLVCTELCFCEADENCSNHMQPLLDEDYEVE